MGTLNEYLAEKRQAIIQRREQAKAISAGPHTLQASVRAESVVHINQAENKPAL